MKHRAENLCPDNNERHVSIKPPHFVSFVQLVAFICTARVNVGIFVR